MILGTGRDGPRARGRARGVYMSVYRGVYVGVYISVYVGVYAGVTPASLACCFLRVPGLVVGPVVHLVRSVVGDVDEAELDALAKELPGCARDAVRDAGGDDGAAVTAGVDQDSHPGVATLVVAEREHFRVVVEPVVDAKPGHLQDVGLAGDVAGLDP